jgi:nitroreductase
MIQGLSSDFEQILEAGNTAPSGENCQPWHFFVREGIIELHLLPERDRSAYSWGQRAAFLSCGSVVENIVIQASARGYRTDVVYFPNRADEWHIANMTLNKDGKIPTDPLAPVIKARVTNRKPYKTNPLSDKERKALFDASAQADGNFAFVENRRDINRLSLVGSTNELVMLANQLLHKFFFSHVNWTKEEDEKKKIGFYIKTLELPPPAEAMFKVFRHWPVMRILGAIGFNRIVAKQNGATNSAAAGIGAFMIDRTEPIDFVKVGRAIERLWLTATAHRLAFQPLTGVLFFKLKIDAGEGAVFSRQEQKLVLDAYQDAAQIFNAGGKHIAFMFRIGHGDAPSAQAVRFPLKDVVTMVS